MNSSFLGGYVNVNCERKQFIKYLIVSLIGDTIDYIIYLCVNGQIYL